jgi:transcriptional regulator with GAF, ATPase, and Fis domain
MPGKEEVQAALARSHQNASAAARELGLHRTQFRRLLTRYGL